MKLYWIAFGASAGIRYRLCPFFVVVLLPKRFNAFLSMISILSISLITSVVSLQVMYYHAIIVDEIGLGGDPVSFFMTLATLLFGMLASTLHVTKSVIHAARKGSTKTAINSLLN